MLDKGVQEYAKKKGTDLVIGTSVRGLSNYFGSVISHEHNAKITIPPSCAARNTHYRKYAS